MMLLKKSLFVVRDGVVAKPSFFGRSAVLAIEE
jgi:hypothetical protein